METPSKSVAFVAGATGFTGREVVAVLAERGHTVVAHVRPDSGRLQQWRDRFEGQGARVDATPWDLEAMTETISELRPTHVFALLGTTRKRAAAETLGSASEAYERIDYGLTALLIDATVAAKVPARFIYLSSVGATEGARGAYMQARVRAERRLRDSGLEYVVVRPSVISGPPRDDPRPMEGLFAKALDGALAVAGAVGAREFRDRYRSTTPRELASGMVELGLDPASVNTVVHAEKIRRRS